LDLPSEQRTFKRLTVPVNRTRGFFAVSLIGILWQLSACSQNPSLQFFAEAYSKSGSVIEVSANGKSIDEKIVAQEGRSLSLTVTVRSVINVTNSLFAVEKITNSGHKIGVFKMFCAVKRGAKAGQKILTCEWGETESGMYRITLITANNEKLIDCPLLVDRDRQNDV
jgi:hypothetical protein